MRRSDPTNNVLPRWAWFLPGLGWTATLVLLYVLNGRTGQIRLFNLSPKDSFLVAVIGTVLVWTVVGLLIFSSLFVAGAKLAWVVYAIPVQLLAYHTAVVMGTDVDQPRNLAKSVTVE